MQVTITGIIRFATLEAPEKHPSFPDGKPKYRLTFNTPKENTEMEVLFDTIKQVAVSKWGRNEEAERRFKGITRTIEEGDNEGNIGLLDGDAFKPEYNAGQFVIKASARDNERSRYREEDGSVMTDGVPKPGDLVRVLIDVWAMAQHKRINFTIQGIRIVQRNFADVGAPQLDDGMVDAALDAPEEEVLALFSGESAPALPAGDTASHSDEAAEAAPKKKKRGRPRKAKKVAADEPSSPPETEGTNLFDGL